MKNFAIVVVGYNRPNSLKRLLLSLNNAVIDNMITLIISLDHNENKACEEISNEFVWKYGEKKIVTHAKSLGLKRHVLECGNYTNEYENILLLEDDLYVSPYFWEFIKDSLDKYNGDDRIAGLGLYNYAMNKSNPYRFATIDEGVDAYFLQFPCSWGQVWNKKKWNKFYEWYQSNDQPFSFYPNVPLCVCKWDERSWLKYYVRYCVEKNLYFVYPKISLVTNFSDLGTHAAESSNEFQIPILMGEKKWNLPEFDHANYLYDAYFENQSLPKFLGLDSVLVDLYGVRQNDVEGHSYWLTTTPAKYKVVKSFGLLMRPRDLNIILDCPGQDIFLYDLSEKTGSISKKYRYSELVYHIGSANTTELLGYSLDNFYRRLVGKISKVLKK